MSERLEDWIDARHLTPAALDHAAARYAADPFETLWFDDFLRADRLDALRGLFETDGIFAPWFGVYDNTQRTNIRFVDAAEFNAASEEQRFERETTLTGPQPQRVMAPGWLTHVKFLYFCGQPPFRQFVQAVTGIDPLGVQSKQIRITGPGHYVRSHTDRLDGRRFCLVLYASRSWQPSDAGRFRQHRPDGNARTLDPLPNRALLFRTTKESFHQVELLSDTAAPRWGYSVWLGESESAS